MSLPDSLLPDYQITPQEQEVVLDTGPVRRTRFLYTTASPPSSTLFPPPPPPFLPPANLRAPDPVTLSWQPPTPAPLSTPSFTSSTIPFGSPPTYQRSRNPTEAVKYTFSQLSFNSMILLPPMNSPDTRPVYHISVHLNCFMPFAFRTVIRRGGTESGEYVGDFQLGIMDMSATVCLRGSEGPISSSLFKTSGSRKKGLWRWVHGDCRIRWNAENGVSPTRICHTITRNDAPRTRIALFTPSDALRKPGQVLKEPELEILPEGFEYFDDILTSILIIERQRLSSSDNMKKLWNWQPTVH